jgi:hypothetical protein
MAFEKGSAMVIDFGEARARLRRAPEGRTRLLDADAVPDLERVVANLGLNLAGVIGLASLAFAHGGRPPVEGVYGVLDALVGSARRAQAAQVQRHA